MKESITGTSERFPWLPAAEGAKYVKGMPGRTSDRWTAPPTLKPCWRGVEREWRLADGISSQTQCYCPYWQRWINASGSACVLCGKRAWPDIERYRVHLLPGCDKKTQEDAILDAVHNGILSEAEAMDLGTEFELG